MRTLAPPMNDTPYCFPFSVLKPGDCSCGAKFEKFVSFEVSSGATAPDLIARTDASPENEARSYWPPPPERNLVNISSEVPAGTALTLQPDCCSNCLT